MVALVNSLLLFGLLTSLSSAAPGHGHIEKRSFKVERRANPNFRGHNGPKLLRAAYLKYGWVVTEELSNAADAVDKANGVSAFLGLGEGAGKKSKAKGDKPNQAGSTSTAASAAKATGASASSAGAGSLNGTASAQNGTAVAGSQVGTVGAIPEQSDVEYLSEVTIGGQKLNLDFDSGSSDLWVYSTKQPQGQTQGHSVYDPAKSTTFKAVQGGTWNISYGDGSGASGIVGTDTVDIGGVTVTSMAVEMATSVSAQFQQDTNNDGLVGLAFSKLNTVKPQKQKTFFDRVAPTLQEPLFTADLRSKTAGSYEFGRIDNAKFTGPMTWIPVNDRNGFWQFQNSGFAVDGGNGAAIQPIMTTAVPAIADTGTTLLLATKEIADGYYQKVGAAATFSQQDGGYVVDCNAQLPDLLLDVGGVYTARIKGSDINFAPVTQGSTKCFGGLQGAPAGVPLQIYGDIFFKSQFVVFNAGNNTLGMAPHVIPAGTAVNQPTAQPAAQPAARSLFA